MKKKIQYIITHPLFSGSMIMMVGSNVVSFLNYIYHFIVGRMLGPAGYGELAAIISLIGLLGIISTPLNLVVTKYVSAATDNKQMATLISWLKAKIFIISLVLSVFILLISPLMSSFLKINNVFYFLLVTVTFFLSIQVTLNRSILQGLLKFKEIVIVIFLENIIKLLVSVLLIYLGFQVGGALWGFVLASVLGWYITNFFLKYQNKNTDPKVDLKNIMSFAFPVLIQSISTTSIYSADVILVKHFFSPHDAGLYASLSTLGKIVFFGAGPISAVMFPLVSKRKATGESYKKIFALSFLATIFLSLSIMVVYWLFPHVAINLLFGAKYLEAANLLVWFGLFMTLFTLSSLLINYSLSLGKTSIVILPLIAAIGQVVMIFLFHQTLFAVILVSIISTALLLISLLIYSMVYGKRILI